MQVSCAATVFSVNWILEGQVFELFFVNFILMSIEILLLSRVYFKRM